MEAAIGEIFFLISVSLSLGICEMRDVRIEG
jgi:hypothetical protein